LQLLNRQAETVTQLTERIREAIDAAIGRVLVRGEISGLRQSAAGHTYFTLKDSTSQIQCVLFKAASLRLKTLPEDGQEAVIHGRVSLYHPRSVYQIIVDWVDPAGEGALHQAFVEMRDRLAAEGLFDESGKRQAGLFPQSFIQSVFVQKFSWNYLFFSQKTFRINSGDLFL